MKKMFKIISFTCTVILTLILVPGLPAAQTHCGEETVTALLAGQTIDVGHVTVSNDAQSMTVSYQVDPPWLITETHLDVATSPQDLKQTKKGNAIPGRFAYKSEHSPAVAETSHTIDLTAWPPGTTLYIAAHCVVVSSGGGSETAWGDGADFPGNNWATYFSHVVQTCEPPVNPGIIQFDQTEFFVSESGVSVQLTLRRDDGTDGEVSVVVSTFDDSATGGEDYDAVTTTVVFADGEAQKTVEIFILDDLADEPDEQFNIELSDVVGATLGDQTSAVCHIIDDDEPAPTLAILSFTETELTVMEDAVFLTITVERTNNTTGEVSVMYETVEDTAVAGADFTGAFATLQFADGETEKSFDIQILNDSLEELDEYFSVRLLNPVAAELGANTEVFITIFDDEEPPQ